VHGVVYAGTAAPGNELAGALACLDQHSWCSRTRGGCERTSPDGTFDIEVYIHDTDSLSIGVDAEGYESAHLNLGGFDCLYCACPPIEFVLQPLPLTPVRPPPTSATRGGTFPLDWPVAPLTPEEILSVRDCDIENAHEKRYPDSIAEEDLLKAYEPQTHCDWAILAFAYAVRGKGPPTSPAAYQAFTHAVVGNPGFALETLLFYRYFDAVSMVRPPAFAQQEITGVRIDYRWRGLGDPVGYSVEIGQADAEPVVTSTVTYPLAIDAATVQALAGALTDLLPVSTSFLLRPCRDNYPQWSVDLAFADNTQMVISTGSNVMRFGGPWFTDIDGQVYVQVSSAFGQALGALIESLGLPLGQPAGMYCRIDTVFDKAFP